MLSTALQKTFIVVPFIREVIGMDIRKATVHDVQDMSRIHALSWKEAYKGLVPQPYLDDLQEDFWVTGFQNWLQNGFITAQLIFDGSIPVGCATYGKSRDNTLPDWGEIYSFYLLPSYSGKGFSHALLTSTLKDLKQAGFYNIYLWILINNERAQSFFHNMGFQKTKDECSTEILGTCFVDIRFVICFDEE